MWLICVFTVASDTNRAAAISAFDSPAAMCASTSASRGVSPSAASPASAAMLGLTVRSLQYLLTARGAKLTVDGVFGPKTKAAVVAFQRAHHLTADGVVGAKTWGVLIVTVKLGSTGAAVRAVQDQANFRNGRGGVTLTVDGIFGPKTQQWVRAFQSAEGFTADGVVGPLTWQALVTESLSG